MLKAKAFDCVDHNKLWKILKEMGIPNHLICLLRNLYIDQEATVRTGDGARLVQNWERSTSKLLNKRLSPSYLTYVQSTSWEMPGWMKHKLESGLSGETSVTSDTQMIPLWCQKVKRNKKASWWGWKKVKVLVTQACPTLFIPMDNSPPGSSVHTILQAKYWSGLLFPSPGDLPNPGAEPKSPYCRHIPYHLNHQESLRVKEDWVKKLA